MHFLSIPEFNNSISTLVFILHGKNKKINYEFGSDNKHSLPLFCSCFLSTAES